MTEPGRDTARARLATGAARARAGPAPALDAELERSRELTAGDETARYEIDLPPRDAPKPLADAV
jgi:hypothetical protein